MKPEATQEADSVRIGESADYRYWAFISYSHAEKGWGDWLHRALETYRVPKHLVGKTGAFGPVPRRYIPYFGIEKSSRLRPVSVSTLNVLCNNRGL